MSARHFSLVAMASFIAVGFLVGWIFPSIPVWVYLAAALLAGVAILAIQYRLVKKTGEIVTDERIQKNADWAGAITFRFSYAVCLLTGFVMLNFASSRNSLRGVGLALVAVGVVQAIAYSILYWVASVRR